MINGVKINKGDGMKKQLIGMSVICMLLGGAGLAQATLITIGTATYDDGSGADQYNLIWDDDNNGNSVVWLDYTNAQTNWAAQNSWAAGLDGQLTYNIDAQYNVTWDDTAWRLPSTVDGQNEWGYDGTTAAGYNITTSEMGHLYYTELGNLGYYDTSGTSQPGYGLQNTGDFNHLVDSPYSSYWSGTEYAFITSLTYAWYFYMNFGKQDVNHKVVRSYGLAMRNGQVSTTAPVPEPTTMLLFGAGLAGLAGLRRRQQAKKG